ncbi:hypothetical protein ACFPH6_38860, partial [Streptomyces xiangluensis]
ELLALHGFTPDEFLGDRSAAPVLPNDFLCRVSDHITERHDPDLGAIPLPKVPLIHDVRHLATIPTKPCGRTT